MMKSMGSCTDYEWLLVPLSVAHACVLGIHIKGHIMWYGSDSNTDVTLGVPLPDTVY